MSTYVCQHRHATRRPRSRSLRPGSRCRVRTPSTDVDPRYRFAAWTGRLRWPIPTALRSEGCSWPKAAWCSRASSTAPLAALTPSSRCCPRHAAARALDLEARVGDRLTHANARRDGITHRVQLSPRRAGAGATSAGSGRRHSDPRRHLRGSRIADRGSEPRSRIADSGPQDRGRKTGAQDPAPGTGTRQFWWWPSTSSTWTTSAVASATRAHSEPRACCSTTDALIRCIEKRCARRWERCSRCPGRRRRSAICSKASPLPAWRPLV